MQLVKLKKLGLKIGSNQILQDICLQINVGDYIGLIGPNGAGKSSLLKCIAGCMQASSGTLSSKKSLKIGYVPQNCNLDLVVNLSVLEVLEMALEHKRLIGPKNIEESLTAVLHKVGLDGDFLEYSFRDLSGGQKQRVLIARSLLSDPELLLFDESLSGVDYQTKLSVHNLLKNLNQQDKIAIIFVSHEIETIVSYCKQIICLDKTIHTGCHPVDFAQGKIKKTCEISSNNCDLASGKKAVHHHHKLN